MTDDGYAVDNQGGVALWRRAADAIRLDIAAGHFGGDGRLPTEQQLAARFGINRHTVRRALAALEQDGLVRSRQGAGRFATDSRRLSYPIGAHTRFSQNLAGQARETHGKLLNEGEEAAPAHVAAALRSPDGVRVLRLETLHLADGRPVSRATSWFPLPRFCELAGWFAALGSMTAALARCGVGDYRRGETRIRARQADAAESRDLQLSPGAVLLVASYVGLDEAGGPFQFTETSFAAERIELVVDAA